LPHILLFLPAVSDTTPSTMPPAARLADFRVTYRAVRGAVAVASDAVLWRRVLRAMAPRTLLRRVRKLLADPDVRRAPVRAITRRLVWRLHWVASSEPVLVSGWWKDLVISLPRSGSAAPVFYDRRPPEPSLAAALVERLPAGGVFVDVGAHIGFYSLIGAKIVGPSGCVFAIEPQPACASAIDMNMSLNGLGNIVRVAAAAGDADGSVRFSVNSRSMGGMIAEAGDFEVPLMRLDTFVEGRGLGYVDLVKLDAAGNEHAALRGASELLKGRRIGALLCKLYTPAVVAERFGYDVSAVVDDLQEAGCSVSVLATSSHPALSLESSSEIDRLFEPAIYSRTLLAVPAAPR
jgi:FkbM family methyltransferase